MEDDIDKDAASWETDELMDGVLVGVVKVEIEGVAVLEELGVFEATIGELETVIEGDGEDEVLGVGAIGDPVAVSEIVTEGELLGVMLIGV